MEIAAIIFVLVMLGVAYITFRILKKTVKMAMRAIIVLVILAVAMTGGIALWSADGPPAKKSSKSTKSSKKKR